LLFPWLLLFGGGFSLSGTFSFSFGGRLLLLPCWANDAAEPSDTIATINKITRILLSSLIFFRPAPSVLRLTPRRGGELRRPYFCNLDASRYL